MIEQMQKAEDEFLGSLGDLGRYLEGGFEVPGDIWIREDVRVMRREEWKDKRDQLEGVLTSAVRAVKGDLKRQGLAGSGAQDRYDVSHLTSRWLPLHVPLTFLAISKTVLRTDFRVPLARLRRRQLLPAWARYRPIQYVDSDAAQAARTAQFDLARYSHHSALLYSVPPSSVSCLDLLVNMYTWTSGLMARSRSCKPAVTPRLNGLNGWVADR